MVQTAERSARPRQIAACPLDDDQHPPRTTLAGLAGRGGLRRPGPEPSDVDESDLATCMRAETIRATHESVTLNRVQVAIARRQSFIPVIEL
jgi:hypothetical protein